MSSSSPYTSFTVLTETDNRQIEPLRWIYGTENQFNSFFYLSPDLVTVRHTENVTGGFCYLETADVTTDLTVAQLPKRLGGCSM